MDTIRINDIRAYGYIGLLQEEQILGQWFSVNLTLWLDLNPSGNSDRLEDTIDYRQPIAIVKNQITTGKYLLVEKLTNVIATEILELTSITKVRVELCKVSPPIPDFGGNIIIDITREN